MLNFNFYYAVSSESFRQEKEIFYVSKDFIWVFKKSHKLLQNKLIQFFFSG